MEECKAIQSQPDFYSDSKKVSEIGKKMKHAEHKLELIKTLQGQIDDVWAMIELCESEDDNDLYNELTLEFNKLKNKID